MAAALADDFAKIILCISVFRNQLLIAERFFKRIEIGTLNVFNDRNFQRGLIVNIAHQHRDFYQPGKLRGAPASFAGYNLKPAFGGCANDDRLNDTVLANRARKVMKLAIIEKPTRVARVAANKFDWNQPVSAHIRLFTLDGQRLIHFADKGCKTAPQTAL
ncbi:hypothetical protein J2X43_004126 [Rhizobium sp. BE258]|nr:hypothetical protein [Rhizobium sp. BE258]